MDFEGIALLRGGSSTFVVYWVAVKDLKLSYYNKETYGNLITEHVLVRW